MSNPKWTTPLDETNSKEFEAIAVPKTAVLTWDAARYELSWGVQTFDGAHMVIGSGDDAYGCELEAFFTTHAPLAEENTWKKVAKIRARRVEVDTDLVTVVKGVDESTSTVLAGGWIVQNPGGEQYYNTPEEFVKRYEEV